MKKVIYSRSGSSHLGERGSKAKRKEALKNQIIITYLLTLTKEQLISCLFDVMSKAEKQQLLTEIIKKTNEKKN